MAEPQYKRTERVDLRRRRLGQAALGGGAVLATLNPGSVRASYSCMAASAAVSFNPSQTSAMNSCSGKSPSAWKTEWQDRWSFLEESSDPSGQAIGQRTGTPEGSEDESGGQSGADVLSEWSAGRPRRGWGDRSFDEAFNASPMRATPTHANASSGRTARVATLYEMLEENDQDLTAYFVAAMLNVEHGLIPAEVFTVSSLKTFYRDVYNAGGYYTPYPGIDWGPAEVAAYLKTTWGGSSIDTLRAQV